MGNAMSRTNSKYNTSMWFDSAEFGQGNSTNNIGIEGEFTDVTTVRSVKPERGQYYPPKQYSNHKFNAIVNPCDTNGTNQFFMKMRLRPYRNYVDGTRGIVNREGQELDLDFNTHNCGTNDMIDFSIIPTTSMPSSAPSTAAPTVAPNVVEPIPGGSASPMPSSAPSEATTGDSMPSSEPSAATTGKGGKGKGSSKSKKSPKSSKSRVRRTARVN